MSIFLTYLFLDISNNKLKTNKTKGIKHIATAQFEKKTNLVPFVYTLGTVFNVLYVYLYGLSSQP